MLASQQRRLRANSEYRVEQAGRIAWAKSDSVSAIAEVNRLDSEKIGSDQAEGLITEALSPYDTVQARNAAISSAVSGLDTTLARNQAIGQAVQGLDTVQARTQALAALAGTIPTFATSTPMPESRSGGAGSAQAVPHADHQHPRLTATATGNLDANGEALIAFTRTFDKKPAVSILHVESANNKPIMFKVKSWKTKNASGALVDRSTDPASTETFDGCIIKGYRGQVLPTLTVVSGILTAVITGVNALVSALSGFDVFNGAASGAEYSFIALQQS